MERKGERGVHWGQKMGWRENRMAGDEMEGEEIGDSWELERRTGQESRRENRKQGEQEAGIYVVLISVITPPPRVPGSSQQPVDDT